MNNNYQLQSYINVIIPLKYEGMYVGECHESIRRQYHSEDRYKINANNNSVVDNTFRTASGVTKIAYCKSGVAAGSLSNYGASNSYGDALSSIDAHCIAAENWLANSIKSLSELPKTVIGGGIRNPGDATWVEKFWILEGNDPVTIPKALIGANIL